jgi:hypothetical protein
MWYISVSGGYCFCYGVSHEVLWERYKLYRRMYGQADEGMRRGRLAIARPINRLLVRRKVDGEIADGSLCCADLSGLDGCSPRMRLLHLFRLSPVLLCMYQSSAHISTTAGPQLHRRRNVARNSPASPHIRPSTRDLPKYLRRVHHLDSANPGVPPACYGAVTSECSALMIQYIETVCAATHSIGGKSM